jgi:TPM domain
VDAVFANAARNIVAIGLFAGLQVGACAADPAPGSVVDTEGLFQRSTIDRAEAAILDLKRQYNFDVRVETLRLSDVERPKVERMSQRRTQARYFAELGRQTAEDRGVNGLSILLFTDPRYVELTVYPRSAESLFSRYQQRRLQRQLADQLQQPRPEAAIFDAAAAVIGFGWQARTPSTADSALLDALAQVGTVLRSQAGDPNAVRPLAIGILLAGGMAVWVVLALASHRMSERKPAEGWAVSAQSTGALAMLAARFGTPTGSWVYDRLFPAAPERQPTQGSITAIPKDGYSADTGPADAAVNDQPAVTDRRTT